MKRELEFDEPIAERVIEGNGCTIIVQLGPPRPETADGHVGWYCPYRINGVPDKPDLQMYGAGEDAIDAIIYALANVGAGINYQEKERLGAASSISAFLTHSRCRGRQSPHRRKSGRVKPLPTYG